MRASWSPRRQQHVLVLAMIVTLVASAVIAVPAGAAAAGPSTPRLAQVTLRSQTQVKAAGLGGAVVANPEIAQGLPGGAGNAPTRNGISAGRVVNRSYPHTARLQNRPQGPADLTPPDVKPMPVTGPTSNLTLSFQGLNHYQNRYAGGGNQFSLEPPDQGLCVGNGFVMETVNDVLRVFDTNGQALSAPTTLNEFYGYPPSVDRVNGGYGPSPTDPSCYYDQEARRWFHISLILQLDPATGAYTGYNSLDVAVSQTANPLGAWNVYSIPTQNNGEQGFPNHSCDLGFCLGDYPQMGADHNGLYITTNEFSFFGTNYNGAQLYALPKWALARGDQTVQLVYFENLDFNGQQSYHVWPSRSSLPIYMDVRNAGTEYFLMTNATLLPTLMSDQMVVWALTNTFSLNTKHPDLALTNYAAKMEVYGDPQVLATQKPGPVPLADCFNDNCLGYGPPDKPQVEGPLDTGTGSGVYGAWSSNGLLWTSLDTVATVNGETRTAAAWVILMPGWTWNRQLTARVLRQGYVGASSADTVYATTATNFLGQGVMAFTLTGDNYYPSAAYVTIDRLGVSDRIHVAGEGVGPQDGFTEYFLGGYTHRWGDYGGATSDGINVWFASEYIAQSCTYQEFLTDFTCGHTRSALANWATRISRLNAGWLWGDAWDK
jgi:hypothetical protein